MATIAGTAGPSSRSCSDTHAISSGNRAYSPRVAWPRSARLRAGLDHGLGSLVTIHAFESRESGFDRGHHGPPAGGHLNVLVWLFAVGRAGDLPRLEGSESFINFLHVIELDRSLQRETDRAQRNPGVVVEQRVECAQSLGAQDTDLPNCLARNWLRWSVIASRISGSFSRRCTVDLLTPAALAMSVNDRPATAAATRPASLQGAIMMSLQLVSSRLKEPRSRVRTGFFENSTSARRGPGGAGTVCHHAATGCGCGHAANVTAFA